MTYRKARSFAYRKAVTTQRVQYIVRADKHRHTVTDEEGLKRMELTDKLVGWVDPKDASQS